MWPEVDTYVNMTPRVRFLFVALMNTNADSGVVQSRLGVNLDYAMRPLLRRRLRSVDPDDNKLLVFRAGYWNFTTLNGGIPNENRAIVETTSRFPLSGNFVLSDRNRADLRWIANSPFSWRYRNRLALARSFTIKHYDFTPYVQAEMYYDSRYDKINRLAYIAGSELPLSKHTQLEPYFEYQHDTSRPRFVETRIVGLRFILYLR